MFLLSVTKVQGSGSKEEDQCLMMSPFLDATKIEVDLHQADISGGTLENLEQRLPFTRLYCLGGLGDVGHSCWQFIADGLRSSHLFHQLSMGLPLGALLITGQRGTGKTSLAGALCKEAAEKLGAYVHIVECKTLKGKRGDTVRQVWERAFEEATWRQPAVVFIDDVDKVVGTSMSVELEQGQEGVLSTYLSSVLKELTSHVSRRRDAVVLLCTAQSTSCLHPSLNTARGQHLFHYMVHLQPPGQVERLEILRILIRSLTLSKDVKLEDLAERTDGFTGADLKALLYNAQLIAWQRLHSSWRSNESKDCVDERPVMNLPHQPATQFLHMPSLQAGFSSPSADRMQELNMELCRLGVDASLDLNVEDVNGEDLHLDISQEHLLDALCNTQPSITDNGVRSWTTVCENFRHTKGMGKAWTPKQDQKVTLA
uniref:AAA+ ATPase domain-containing protein n=1 Tax=Eptatretus burgeri TaxID=7764 RepID=A0A8C4Q995_EPTBU